VQVKVALGGASLAQAVLAAVRQGVDDFALRRGQVYAT
jgi:hypothetical protein